MWISGLILIGVVVCMALDLKTVPLHTAAVTGAILCVITGCLKEKEAYAGIDWVTIFLFAGMLSVATGISIAQNIGCDPKPVLMALGIAASMAFATPMATPPNTLVLGPGGFTFNDYVKVGVPMCIISWIACVIIIPIFWPF
ncbi:putative transmembrane sodium/sulfate transporter [Bacteroides xylanisolvens]|nr:putative transmembrane sodium/sulfate transporter [Bacteroides xylanisolvens]